MRVLVTGAAGMLGRDLVAHLAGRHDVTAVDLEVDVTDPAAVGDCVAACRPEAVFHLAAWTDVDGAEAHEAEAAAVNADGAGTVAAAAAAAGAALVLPSTDYVFDGRKGAPYVEDDAPGPLGAYGRTKLAGERAARERHPGGARVARTAWLYGAGGRWSSASRAGARSRVQVGDPVWSSTTSTSARSDPSRRIVSTKLRPPAP